METLAVMKTLRRQEAEKIYVKVLEDIYKEITSTIKVSDKTPIQKEVRQDDNISSKLFTVILEKVFTNLEREEAGVQKKGKIDK